MRSFIFLSFLVSIWVITACNKAEDVCTQLTNNFTITITNTFEEKESLQSGVTGVVEPGATASYSFHVDALSGDKLSLVSMLSESNDWFVALDKIALFVNGKAFSGNSSDQLILCDAGTELSEHLGAGKNQGERQIENGQGAGEYEFIRVITHEALLPLSEFIRVEIVAN